MTRHAHHTYVHLYQPPQPNTRTPCYIEDKSTFAGPSSRPAHTTVTTITPLHSSQKKSKSAFWLTRLTDTGVAAVADDVSIAGDVTCAAAAALVVLLPPPILSLHCAIPQQSRQHATSSCISPERQGRKQPRVPIIQRRREQRRRKTHRPAPHSPQPRTLPQNQNSPRPHTRSSGHHKTAPPRPPGP